MKKTIVLAFILIGLQSQAQFNLSWVTSLGGISGQSGDHIATDASGNIYTVGTFSDVTDVDPTAGTQTVMPEGLVDIYVIKQSSSGSLIWAKTFGGTGADWPAGVAVDNLGNVYISGTYGGAIDLDPSASTYSFFSGSIEVFVTKWDAAGNIVWGASMGSGANDFATAMCIDASGNVYTAGTFEAMMDFDPGPGTYQITPFGSSGTDVFISKLDANGNFGWAVNLGGTMSEEPRSICVDALLNVYTVGYFQGIADFDPGAGTFTFTSNGNHDAFISKLDGNGSFVWAKQIGGVNYDEANSIVADATNNVYVVGDYAGTVDFDPGAGTFTLASTSTTAQTGAFAVKLTSAGNFVWAKSINDVQATTGKIARLGPGGNLYWTGTYYNTIDLDPGAGVSNSILGYPWYLSVLDGLGNFVKSECFPYYWGSFVVNSSSEIIITGSFSNADFDPSPTNTLIVNSTGSSDACILKLNQGNPNGLSDNSNPQFQNIIYPNPSNGKFEVELSGKSLIRIENELGQLISVYNLEGGTHLIQLNCKDGVYLMQIIDEKNVRKVQKLLIGN